MRRRNAVHLPPRLDLNHPKLCFAVLLRVFVLGPLLSVPLSASLGCSTAPEARSGATVLTAGFGVGGTAQPAALQFLLDSLSAEPLVAVDWNGRPQPKLATRWFWEDEGRTLRIQLREGVVFHDGTPLTADIVASDLRRLIGQRAFGRVTSIEAAGSSQVVVRLKEVDALLLDELNKTPIKFGHKRTHGTGPFVLRAEKPDLELESFSRHYPEPSSIAKVVVRTYETPRGAWAAMMRGDIDFLYEVNRDAVDFVEAESRIETFSFPRPYYIPLVFNVAHPVLGKRAVRQAINEAIDRQAVVRTALNNRGKAADGPIWPDHWAYNPAGRTYSYNPDAARVRLDAAGFPLRAGSGSHMPSRFSFRCLFWAEDPQFERVALVVQKQLFDIGIDAEMVPMTVTEIGKRHVGGDFDAIMVPMASGRSLDWVYWFWRSPQDGAAVFGRSGYTAADSTLDRLRAARSDEETRLAVADLQRIMYDDPPAAFLVRPDTARAVDESFVVPVPADEKGRDILGSLWQWRPRTGAGR